MKTKHQVSGLQGLEKLIAAYFRGNEPNPEGFYYPLLLHVKKHPDGEFRVETIASDVSAYELLKAEQMALDAGRFDSNCLNNNTEAYIPENLQVENGMYGGYIRPIDKTNFINWKRDHRIAPKRTPRARKKPAV